MSGNTGLYFPWIHFRDDDWVKLSMLYWKRLQRIVPPNYPTHDSGTVEKFVEHGLITDVDPSASADEIAPMFAEVIRRSEGRLRDRYGLWMVGSDDDHRGSPRDAMQRFEEGDPGLIGGPAFVHTSKIASDLRDQLVDSGLGVPNRGGNPEWIGVHPQIARVYMTALAEDIAGRSLVHPVSEDPVDLVAVSGWSLDRLTAALLGAGHGTEISGLTPDATLAFMAVRSVVPANLGSVSATKIVEVRDRYHAELLSFQRAIQEVSDTAQLAAVTDPAALQLHLTDAYEDHLAPKLSSLERDLRKLGIDTALGYVTMKATIPTGLGMGLAEVGADDKVAAGTAVLLAAVGVGRSMRSRRNTLIEQSPAAYLLRLKTDLSPTGLRGRVRAALRTFGISR
jgi:hypothetical protein